MAGVPVRRTASRDKKNLVLTLLPDAEDDGARAILRGERSSLADAQRELALPFPLLHDADGAASARFLPPMARAGVFVTDRYGELYFAAPTADTTTLPSSAEILAWLEAIDRQCAF